MLLVKIFILFLCLDIINIQFFFIVNYSNAREFKQVQDSLKKAMQQPINENSRSRLAVAAASASNNTDQGSSQLREMPSTTMTSNTTMSSEVGHVNVKCHQCDKDLDGSFRTMKHMHCGLRYCAHHLQELVSSSSLNPQKCPKCNKDFRKEELICTPSLSASAKEQSKQQPQQAYQRMKLMSSLDTPNLSMVGSSGNNSSTILLYECPICNLSGLSHGQLLDHSKQHANVPGKCPICWHQHGRDYFSKHLYGHLMLRHKEVAVVAPVQASSGKATVGAPVDHHQPNNTSSTMQARQSKKSLNSSATNPLAQTISHRNQAQTTNQTQLQASKGIQQSQQQKQPGLPASMNKMPSASNPSTRQPQIQAPGANANIKGRRNTTHLSAMAGAHGHNKHSQAVTTQPTPSQSALSSMLQQMQNQANPGQSLHGGNTTTTSTGATATQASRKKTGGSHRQSIQSNNAPHAQFAAAAAGKRGPSGGAKTPQIGSQQQSQQQMAMMHGSRHNKAMPGSSGISQKHNMTNTASHPHQQQMMVQSKAGSISSSAAKQRGFSAREASQSISSHLMFNNTGAGSGIRQTQTSQYLSQGLLGVYAFSTVNVFEVAAKTAEESNSKTPQSKRRLQLTSQYVASAHKFSLLKRLSPTTQPFKLTDLDKFLHSSNNQNEEGSEETDDGLSSASSRCSQQNGGEESGEGAIEFPDDETKQEIGTPVSHVKQKQQTTAHKGKGVTQQFKTKAQYMQQPQHPSKNQQKRKTQPGRMSIDAGRLRQVQRQESELSSAVKDQSSQKQRRVSLLSQQKREKQQKATALQVPVYLQEIERICFPEAMPSEKKVLLQKDSKVSLQNFMIDQEKLSPEQSSKMPQNVAQSPHLQNYFSQGKKFSVSPHTKSNYKSGLHLKQPLKDGQQAATLKDLERHNSLPRFNSSVNTPQMMLIQKGVSPKGHYGTKRIQELCHDEQEGDAEEELNPCTLEDFEKFHKQVFYSTRTADDKLQYLSILVCAQPHLLDSSDQSNLQHGSDAEDRQEFSDAIISDEDDFEVSKGVKATLQPFVLVIVTSKPVFESAMGSQLLALIYQKCFQPFYRKICFPSPLLGRHFFLCQQLTNDMGSLRDLLFNKIDLEVVLSMLFDVLNIFYLAKEDTYRRVTWQDPLQQQQASQSILQVNQIFVANQNIFFDGNFSFKMLFELIQIDDLIKILSCLLLEKKIVLLGDNEKYQQQMAPLIEALLKLLYPLDSQVYTCVTYTLSQDMVYYMEKPGSIIMGMPNHLWKSHGNRVFNESFDTYIVVYDLQEKCFHLKTPEEPIGLPRTFSKLLRRSISSIDTAMSDAYMSFQIRQAVFNTVLLMISFLKGKEATKATKQFKAKISKDQSIDETANQSEDSANSVQTIRDGQLQYPYSKEFFKEFKNTTAFIDLSDKLERKDSSVTFITDCLSIIEHQRIDWFEKLLEFQVQFMAADVAHIVKLFYPQANQRIEDLFKELSFDEIVAVHKMDQPKKNKTNKGQQRATAKEEDKYHVNFLSIADGFKIQKQKISKTLRAKLFEVKSFALVKTNKDSEQFSGITPSKNIKQSATKKKTRGGVAPLKIGSRENLSSRNQLEFSSQTPVHIAEAGGLLSKGIQDQISSMNVMNSMVEQQSSEHLEPQKKPPRFPQQPERDTPHQSDSSKKQQSQSALLRTPPDNMAERAAQPFVVEESDVPPSSSRAARYGSTHKPQISFQQIRSSDSPPSAAMADNTPKIDSSALECEETPKDDQKLHSDKQFTEDNSEVKAPENAASAGGGFFSMITNFFSSNKGPEEDAAGNKEGENNGDKDKLAVNQSQNFKEELKEIQTGRKASKSMQVMQPQFMNFCKPIDMQEVGKIKTLASGLHILNSLNENNQHLQRSYHRKQKSSIDDLRKIPAHHSLNNHDPSQTDHYIFAQTQKQFQLQLPQQQPPHMRQETATFVRDQSGAQLYSGSKRVDTAQFAAPSPHKTSTSQVDLTEKQKTLREPNDDHLLSKLLKPFTPHEQVSGGLFSQRIANDGREMYLSMDNHQMAKASQRQSQALQINRFQEALNQVENKGLTTKSAKKLKNMKSLEASQVPLEPYSMDCIGPEQQQQQMIHLVNVNEVEDDSGTAMQTFANEEQQQMDPHLPMVANDHFMIREQQQEHLFGYPQKVSSHQNAADGDHQVVQNEPVCLSARCSNDSTKGMGVNQEVRISAPSYIISQRNPVSASNGKQQLEETLKVGDQQQSYPSRPSFPISKISSPKANRRVVPFWSAPQDVVQPQKRLSLNTQNAAAAKGPLNIKQQPYSSKGSGNVTSEHTAGYMQGMNSSKSGGKESSANESRNVVRTATINLEQPAVLQQQRENLISTSKAASETQQPSFQSTSNSQKLKVTISKLQSKQTQGQQQQFQGGSKVPMTISQPLLQTMAQANYNTKQSSFKDSQLQQQQHASQSALSFTKLQKEAKSGTMRNLKQCISPKIVANKHQHQVSNTSNANSQQQLLSKNQLLRQSYQPNNSSGNPTSMLINFNNDQANSNKQQQAAAASTNLIKLQKQLSSSSQNLTSALSHNSSTRRTAQQVLSNGDPQLFETSRRGASGLEIASRGDQQRLKKSSQKEGGTTIMDSKTGASSTLASRSKKLAGEIASSNVHLFSPRKSVSPRQEQPFKSRPKAYSQISRGQAAETASASNPNTHLVSKQSQPSNMTSQNQYLSKSTVFGSQHHRQTANTNQQNPATALFSHQHSGSHQQLASSSSRSTNILQGLAKQAGNPPMMTKQLSHQSRTDGKRNSMGQLPKAQVILASRHQAGEKSGGSNFQKVADTPSDFHPLDSTMPKNPRKQQRLTNVAEEKKGDEEQVIEMENIQEGGLDDGFEGSNRIRSISHQFPSNKVSFLRASQDKMQVAGAIGPNLNERSVDLMPHQDAADKTVVGGGKSSSFSKANKSLINQTHQKARLLRDPTTMASAVPSHADSNYVSQPTFGHSSFSAQRNHD